MFKQLKFTLNKILVIFFINVFRQISSTWLYQISEKNQPCKIDDWRKIRHQKKLCHANRTLCAKAVIEK